MGKRMCIRAVVLSGVVLFLAAASVARAQDVEADFHKAYYLEMEEGDLEAAATLYASVAESDRASPELVQQARRRLASCRELLRGADLSRLMPPEVLAYIELRQPGKHAARLLRMAGLTPDVSADESRGGPPLPVVVSPRLLKSLETAPGLAVAVTNVHPRLGIPSAVAVLNLGRSDLAHGAVETALSTAVASNLLNRGDAVEGHATYMSPFGTVVVTERFVFAGNPHQLVVEAVHRLHAEDARGLSDTEAFKEVAEQRGDSLLFAFVNARRAVALGKAALSGGRGLPEEYRWAQVAADIESFDWAAIRVGTSDHGLAADAWLRMDDDNHALVYHLLRTSPLGRDALRAIPAGAAGFLGLSLAPDGTPGNTGTSRADVAKWVTGLDLGREIFANIQDVLLFALPPSALGETGGSPQIPPVGVVLTARDASKSRVLWETVLGVSAMVSQEGRESFRREEVNGHEVRVYEYPEQVRVYFAGLPDRVVLATNRAVILAAVKAGEGAGSVLDDEAFAGALDVASGATKIACVDAGRMLEVAQPVVHMSPGEAQQIAALLQDKTATILTRESPSRLQVSVVVRLDNIGAFLQQLLNRQFLGRQFRRTPVPSSGTAVITRARARRTPSWPAERTGTIVPRGTVWKYSDTGADLGTAWREPGFDDSSWKEGAAPLGYGEDSIATTVGYGDNVEAKRITTYFRARFVVDRPEEFDALRIHLCADDGAAVYINGQEVVRTNLAPGAGASDTSTGVVSGAAEGIYAVFPVKNGVLRAGGNVIAAEVHQSSPQSSDLVLDLALEGRTAPRPPAPSVATSGR